jgi:hypothetical protein
VGLAGLHVNKFMNHFMIVCFNCEHYMSPEGVLRAMLNRQNKRLALEFVAISNKNMLDKPSIKTVEGESLHGMVCGERLLE